LTTINDLTCDDITVGKIALINKIHCTDELFTNNITTYTGENIDFSSKNLTAINNLITINNIICSNDLTVTGTTTCSSLSTNPIVSTNLNKELISGTDRLNLYENAGGENPLMSLYADAGTLANYIDSLDYTLYIQALNMEINSPLTCDNGCSIIGNLAVNTITAYSGNDISFNSKNLTNVGTVASSSQTITGTLSVSSDTHFGTWVNTNGISTESGSNINFNNKNITNLNSLTAALIYGTSIIYIDILGHYTAANDSTINTGANNKNINLSPNGTGSVKISTSLNVDSINSYNSGGNLVLTTSNNHNVLVNPDGTGYLGYTTSLAVNTITHYGTSSDLTI